MKTSAHAESSSRDYKPYLIIFLTAVCARAFFLVLIDEPALFMKYPFFAEKLVRGEDIGTRLVDLSPFYLYFMTVLKKIFGLEWTTAKVIQSFAGAVNSLLVCALGGRVFSREAGFWGGMIFALYGNLIILESTLEPTVFILQFNLLCIYFLYRVQESLNDPGEFIMWTAIAGLFAGLSIVTKPNSLLLLPLVTVWIAFSARNVSIQDRLKIALTFCCIAFVVVLPVTVRNYVKLKDFVLVTADGGKVFFHGSGKGATALEGTGLPDEGFAEENTKEPDYAHVLYRKTASRLSGKELSPSESSKFWFRRTLSNVTDDPLSYLKLELKKLFYFFNNYEMHYIASAYKEYKASLSFPFIRYGLIASFALLGMILSLPGFRDRFLIYGMVGLYIFSGMLFLVQSRYRTPAVPYLCLFAAYGVLKMKTLLATKRFKGFAAACAGVGVCFALTHLPLRGEIEGVDAWQQGTKIHYQSGARPLFKMGKYEEAVSELNRCVAVVPNFSPAYNLRGKSLALLGKNREALSDFKKVIALSPNFAEGYRNAGFLYVLKNDMEKARVYLEKALVLAPQDSKVKDALMNLH